MKFAVGDKVIIKSANKNWNGVKAVVKDVDPTEGMYPYNLTLTEDTLLETYKAGNTAEAFREAELVALDDAMQEDIAEAVRLLQKHGVVFRMYTREDVDRMLDHYSQDPHEPLDTVTFREELVEFIMEGQDWGKLSEKGQDDEAALWNLVEGARNDHPEWFVG